MCVCVCVWGGVEWSGVEWREGVTNEYDYIMKVEERLTNMNVLGKRGRKRRGGVGLTTMCAHRRGD